MKWRETCVVLSFLCLIGSARAELSATDDFQSYTTTITDTSGGSGNWTTNWRGCSEFDGGTYLSTDSRIDGTQSYGVYGSGGSNGTGVRRAFTSSAGQLRFQWSYRANYDVTTDDGNGGLTRRLAYTLRNGDDPDHFTGQRLSFFFAEGSPNFAWYDGTNRNTNAVTFAANSVYDCAVSVSTGLRTYTLSVSNRSNGANFTYSGSWTTGSAGDQLGSVSFLMRGPSGAGNDAFLDSVSISQIAVPWPGGAAAGYASDPAARIHHFKEQAVIGNGYILCMLDFNGSLYDIYYPSIGGRQGSGTANEGYRGPEEFPACSLDAEANGQMNVINAMGGIGVIAGGTNAIYWLKNQGGTDYTSVGQKWLNDDVNVVLTTNKLNITGNNILVQQIDFVPSTDAIPVDHLAGAQSTAARTNYGVYVKRFLLTNLEASDKTIDFYYDANFNVKGANVDDGMYFETTVGGTNYNSMIVYDNADRTITGANCVNGDSTGPNGYGDDGTGSFDANRNYKMVSGGDSYSRNASVYFATVMKVVTNASSGWGLPAQGSWRDHTPTDNQEGWIGRRITIPAGQTNEVDIMIVGSWDDAPNQTGVNDFWGRPLITWFYNNSMATAQATTESYWSNWINSGVTVDLPGTDYDRLFKRQLLVSAVHQDKVTGAIIAGSHNGAYPFSWPRDGCFAAIAFDRTGHTNEGFNYLHFLKDVAYRGDGGTNHFFQKYSTNGYKIWGAAQPDETASVPWAMFYHYQVTGDATFLTNAYSLAYTAARSSSEDSPYDANLYYDDTYNLVHGNNVWEDSNDEFIYSNASIVRGLRDAANIADLTGNAADASLFRSRANAIKGGIDARIDARVEPADISHVGMVMPYEVYEPNDARMTNMVEWIHGRQASGGHTDTLVESDAVNYPDSVGLLNRYVYNVGGAHDNYWNTNAFPYGHSPWFLATSWYGEYFARWQDYLPGKSLINTNLYTLNLLTNKMDQMLIGAEQIAPSTREQKYPGFWLQTSWPNLWEADLTLVDQIMMFLDYKPQATNNTCYFAPKLPSAWSTMTFNNLLFKNQRFNITVTETATSTRADINKLTAGVLDYDIWLRIPADQTPALVITNGALHTTYTYDGTAHRVRVQGPLASGTGLNSIIVTFGNSDVDGDGMPDSYEIANGLNPLVNDATGDLDGDGQSNFAEFLAGTAANDPNSVLRITQIARLAGGDTELGWSSVSGKQYVVEATTNLVLQPFTAISATNAAVNPLTLFTNTPAVPAQFYRIKLIP